MTLLVEWIMTVTSPVYVDIRYVVWVGCGMAALLTVSWELARLG